MKFLGQGFQFRAQTGQTYTHRDRCDGTQKYHSCVCMRKWGERNETKSYLDCGNYSLL